ncbi:hypothetical protein PR048_027267 [Dryococelus australis]|uniref:dolichyl-phosphate-mannose--protein mannosyltransferase n=1 Tax=Dryococelus australis TaxID=614101 RepID=A0ABQ9GEY8_9NEOP|nr:hypothetical protein PR048_027267 [Dryococelus australis]
MLWRHMALVLAGTLMLLLRWRVMGSAPPTFQKVDNPASFADSFSIRVLTYNYVYALNAWLLVCPEWLCFDWSMGCVPLLSARDTRLVGVAALWLVLAMLLWRILSLPPGNYQRSLTMATALMLVPFLPATNLFFRVGFVIAERVLYLPSAGFCMLVVLGCSRVLTELPRARHVSLPRHTCRGGGLGELNQQYSGLIGLLRVTHPVFSYPRTLRQSQPEVVGVCYLLLLLVFGVRASWRSAEWCSETTLFTSALGVCPLNAKVHYNVAKNAADAGNKSYAVQEYKIALRLYPEYDQAMNNLANILRDEQRLSEAELLLRRAVELRQDFAAAWMNLGIVLSNMRRYREAEESYITALQHRRNYPDCLYNLGNLVNIYIITRMCTSMYCNCQAKATPISFCGTRSVVDTESQYLEQQRYEDALLAWRNATALKPTHTVAWNNMVIMLDNIGHGEQAELVAQQALAVLPSEPSLHFNLANVLGKSGRFAEAEKHFLEAITFDHNNPMYHTNLGKHVTSFVGCRKVSEAVPRVRGSVVAEVCGVWGVPQIQRLAILIDWSWPLNCRVKSLGGSGLGVGVHAGVLYHRWKKYPQAERQYRRALELSPQLQSALENMALLQRTLARARTNPARG